MLISYDKPDEWLLFLNNSERCLKCVLLPNGNQYACIPIAHSTKMKEEYQNIKEALGKLCYMEHQWVICVDLKMVNFLLGQQSRCIKYPCFYVFWGSRDKAQH